MVGTLPNIFGWKSLRDDEHSTMQPSGLRSMRSWGSRCGNLGDSSTTETFQPRISANRRMPASFISWTQSPRQTFRYRISLVPCATGCSLRIVPFPAVKLAFMPVIIPNPAICDSIALYFFLRKYVTLRFRCVVLYVTCVNIFSFCCRRSPSASVLLLFFSTSMKQSARILHVRIRAFLMTVGFLPYGAPAAAMGGRAWKSGRATVPGIGRDLRNFTLR